MGADQTFLGVLGFESADEAETELAETRAFAGSSAGVLAGARRDDCVIAIDVHGSMPSSHWLPLVGAIAELGARAVSGHVTCLYSGDGRETCVAGPELRARALAPRPSRWLPLEAKIPHALVRGGASTEASFDVVRYARGARGLDVLDWLGLFMHLVPDGDRVYAMPAPWGDERVDLSVPRPGLQLVLELDRPGATHTFAWPGKERISVFRVVGLDGTRLAVEVVEHDVPFDAPDVAKRSAPSTRRLWLEEGRGLVALHAD